MSDNNIADKGFINQIIELDNGWIQAPDGKIYTPNDHLGQTSLEVYENHMKDLANPPTPELSIEDKISILSDKLYSQTLEITTLQNELSLAQQENANLYYELMMGGVI